VCKKNDVAPSKVLSKEQQKMVFVKRGIVVPAGTRCCRHHLYNNHLSYHALQEITPAKVDLVSFDANSVAELVTDCCTTIQNMKTFDFDDPNSLNEESYYNMTGLRKGINH
jgi:hypothetical protein